MFRHENRRFERHSDSLNPQCNSYIQVETIFAVLIESKREVPNNKQVQNMKS